MNNELDKKLCDKYPEIFRDRHGDKMATAMCWGFECGDGWYDIIDTLCGCIQSYTTANSKPQVVASQVKEKYGTLRFYTQGHDDTVDGIIRVAEEWSSRTCEVCGQAGVLHGSNWVKTLCYEHARVKGYPPIEEKDDE
jgi:hypothetical protein